MSQFRPMLAGKFDPNKIVFPAFVSPKLDGIRGCVHQGQALTRSLKKIPNKYIFQALSVVHLEGLDGELIVGEPWATDVYRVTDSAVMSHEGTPNFKFYVFDNFNSTGPFRVRNNIAKLMADVLPCTIEWLEQHEVNSLEEVYVLESLFLSVGYEGIIIRAAEGPYKYGRSTTNEGWLIKKKNFEDDEALVVGFEEMMHNDNEAGTNELGRTFRSKAADGMRASGVMGAVICQWSDGDTFKVGSGWTMAEREEIWANQEKYRGLFLRFKSFKIGVKDAPRHAVRIGFRNPRDM